MILVIMFSVFTLAGLILMLLSTLDVFYNDDEAMIWGASISLFCGIPLLIGLIVCGVNHSKYVKNKKTIEVQERLEAINNTRDSLEHKISSETYTVLEINAYNESVREYKTSIKQAHVDLSNPWINWFICPIYNEFAEDAVSYLYVK